MCQAKKAETWTTAVDAASRVLEAEAEMTKYGENHQDDIEGMKVKVKEYMAAVQEWSASKAPEAMLDLERELRKLQRTTRVIDGKFIIQGGKLVKESNGEILPEDEPLILMRARDCYAIPTLHYYLNLHSFEGDDWSKGQ